LAPKIANVERECPLPADSPSVLEELSFNQGVKEHDDGVGRYLRKPPTELLKQNFPLCLVFTRVNARACSVSAFGTASSTTRR
jgi:hypothetical protein